GVAEVARWSVRRVGGVVSAGVGVLALGTAGYLALRALDEQERSEHECGAAGCTKAGNELREKAGSFADASAVTAAAGAVLLGVGATLFFLPSSESARPQTGIRAVLVPGAGRIAVAGSFRCAGFEGPRPSSVWGRSLRARVAGCSASTSRRRPSSSAFGTSTVVPANGARPGPAARRKDSAAARESAAARTRPGRAGRPFWA